MPEYMLSESSIRRMKELAQGLSTHELGTLLVDSRFDNRARVISSILADVGDPAGAEYIMAYWQSKSSSLGFHDLLEKTGVVTELLRFPAETVSEITTRYWAEEPHGDHKNAYLSAFRYGDPQTVVPILERILHQDPGRWVQQQVLVELGNIRHARSAALLLATMLSGDRQLASKAVVGLANQNPDDLAGLDVGLIISAYRSADGGMKGDLQMVMAQHHATLGEHDLNLLEDDVINGRSSTDPFTRYAANVSFLRLNRNRSEYGSILIHEIRKIPSDDTEIQSVFLSEMTKVAARDVNVRSELASMLRSGTIVGKRAVSVLEAVFASSPPQERMTLAYDIIRTGGENTELLRSAVLQIISTDRSKASEFISMAIRDGSLPDDSVAFIQKEAAELGVAVK